MVAEEAIALVCPALAGGSFLSWTELLEPLLDRVSSLCALNPAFGPEFGRHRDRIELTCSAQTYRR